METATPKLNSAYWASEIYKTQQYMSELVHGEIAGVKSTKNFDDSMSLQDSQKEIKKCQVYIAYCQNMYNEAIEEEGGTAKRKGGSILYFNSGYGY